MRTGTSPETPDVFAVRPTDWELVKEAGMAPRSDLLSAMLQAVHLSGEHVLGCAPPKPFAVSLPDSHGVLHLVDRGELEICLLDEAGVAGDPVLLQTGDVALLPQGHEHLVRTPGPAMRSRRLAPTDLVTPHDPDREIQWLCGSFICLDNLGDSRLTGLPPLITFQRAELGTPDWLAVSRAQLLAEVATPSQGSAVMIARILDLVFVQVLRAWASTGAAESSWLAGAMDSDIGPALVAIHQQPAKAWTVADLAQISSLSRSTFADRFTRLVGSPPATYLTELRLDSAARRIGRSRIPVRTIAHESGYSSEAAFSRAFRRRFEKTPSQWRAQF